MCGLNDKELAGQWTGREERERAEGNEGRAGSPAEATDQGRPFQHGAFVSEAVICVQK
jgi:hypothetical protein